MLRLRNFLCPTLTIFETKGGVRGGKSLSNKQSRVMMTANIKALERCPISYCTGMEMAEEKETILGKIIGNAGAIAIIAGGIWLYNNYDSLKSTPPKGIRDLKEHSLARCRHLYEKNERWERQGPSKNDEKAGQRALEDMFKPFESSTFPFPGFGLFISNTEYQMDFLNAVNAALKNAERVCGVKL